MLSVRGAVTCPASRLANADRYRLRGRLVLNLQSGNTIISTGWFALANMGEVLFAALAVSYVFKGVPRLNSPKTLAQYGMFVVILPSFVSAFIGALAGGEGDYWLKWRIWFFTDSLALLILPSAVWGWSG